MLIFLLGNCRHPVSCVLSRVLNFRFKKNQYHCCCGIWNVVCSSQAST